MKNPFPKQGPGIFLAQVMGNPRYNTLEKACRFAAESGFTHVQLPSWDPGVIDLKIAAESKDYCDQLIGQIMGWGLKEGVSELATHLQGQLAATTGTYAPLYGTFGFLPKEVQGFPSPLGLRNWALPQLKNALRASKNLGCTAMPTFSGSLMWQFIYPWPQRPAGMVDIGMRELAKIWDPIFRVADEVGVTPAFEPHPGEDLHDGESLDAFLKHVDPGLNKQVGINYDPSHFVLMCLDYLRFIAEYYPRIVAYHVKDAEFVMNGKSGVYGGFLPWKKRPGKFLSVGDGQVDFAAIESLLKQYELSTLPHVLEWECAFKGLDQGAREGAEFIHALINWITLPIRKSVIPHNDPAFDDFAASGADEELILGLLGLRA